MNAAAVRSSTSSGPNTTLWISVVSCGISNRTGSPARTRRVPGKNERNATSRRSLPARTTLPAGTCAASRFADFTVAATWRAIALPCFAFDGAPLRTTRTLPFMPGCTVQRYV